jgi:indolepyruvate ferredoxin oxidoreductase beta subunit
MQNETIKPAVVRQLEPAGAATERPVSIAIVAMGGQGGAVLTNWIVALAESQGWIAQATSVPGVAQRTGATIYYIETMQSNDSGQRPVLAQMPTPDDVDVVIAAEYMEAGRSILRGLVTPQRTTLIASDHRALATSEKMAPGNGIADSNAVSEAIGAVAKQEIVFDMNAMAVANGSVISSALFGSLAASDVLPFKVDAYHDVIRSGGKGIEASINTFDAAYERTRNPPDAAVATDPEVTAAILPDKLQDSRAHDLLQRIKSELPASAQLMAFTGVQKVVDFQDIDYGNEYLDLLRDITADDSKHGGMQQNFRFTEQAAKHLANAMCYDDVIRVARIKTAAARRQRIETEMGMSDSQLLSTTEFMHPRMAEVCGVLPTGFAKWLMARKGLYRWLDKRIDKGRRVKTYSLRWFLMLQFVGSLKSIRRRSLRHHTEVTHRDAWLTEARNTLADNYELAVEILRFRRLIKGYSDTHDRAHSKFDKVMNATRLIATRTDAAEQAELLLSAAINDADGVELDERIKSLESAS